MFRQLVRFEIWYHVRRAMFALVAFVVCGMALVLVQTGFGADSAFVNSSYAVMRASGLLSLWLLFSQTLFTANGVLRDEEHNMRELILSRPLSRATYFASRFTGVVFAGFASMSLAVVVLMLAPLILPLDPEFVGPLRPETYLMALSALILPNLLLISALLCGVAWFTRSTLATYAGGVAIFALYMTAAMLGDSPLMANSTPPSAEGLARSALTDPLGISAVFEQTRYWTLTERNTRLVTLTGPLLYNRLIVLAVVGLTFSIVLRFVSLEARTRKHRRLRFDDNVNSHSPDVAYTPIAPTATRSMQFWSALLSSVRLELKQLFGTRVFQALLLLFVFVTAVETYSRLLSAEYGTRILASSGAIVGSIPLKLFALLCVVYFGTEIVWRERLLRVNGLIDATPASNGVFVLSKLLALTLVPMALCAVGLVVAMVVQIVGDGLPVDPVVYLSQFWYAAYPLSLTAVLVVTILAITSNRWVGMVVAMLLVVLAQAGILIGIEHPMLRFAEAPALSYSDFDGYGSAAYSFAAFMIYWTVGAVFLGTVAWSAWTRGVESRGIIRLLEPRQKRWHPKQGTNRVRFALAGSAVAFCVTGGILFFNTNILHTWENTDASNLWHADYERRYRHIAAKPQPTVNHVDIAVDFTSHERRADIRGVLDVRNRTSSPIDTVWLTLRREARNVQLEIPEATMAGHDRRFGVYQFAFSSPLLPGDSATVKYELTIASDGIRADGYNADVTANGSYMTMLVAMPSFGYRPSYELRDKAERAKQGLRAETQGLLPHSAIDSLKRQARAEAHNSPWITLHSVLSATDGHVALGPGELVRRWRDGERSYFEYDVQQRMPPRFGFVSGDYTVVQATENGVAIEFWHHPAHDRNARRFVDAAALAIRTFDPLFGSYPRKDLRLIEVPNEWPFAGFALTGMLMFNENRGVLTDARDEDVDLLTRRVAHEVAHQWWGYSVDPLETLGATTIVETLAKYSEQLALEAARGAEVLPQLLAYDHDRYLAGRARDRDPEPTLIETSNQDYLFYGKGAVAMNSLRAVLGDSAVTAALQTLIRAESGPRGAATAIQLYELLKSEARSSLDSSLVDEWFTERVIYDLRADSASFTKVSDRFQVRAVFSTRRIRLADGAEFEETASGQQFDVVIHNRDGEILHRGSLVASRDRAELVTFVEGEPASIEIDPWIRRIDRERSDNVRSVTAVNPQ